MREAIWSSWRVSRDTNRMASSSRCWPRLSARGSTLAASARTCSCTAWTAAGVAQRQAVVDQRHLLRRDDVMLHVAEAGDCTAGPLDVVGEGVQAGRGVGDD